MRALATALASLALVFTLACGKYGPPVRAGTEPPPKRKPSFQIPLPSVPEGAEPTPTAPSEPPPEQEPPPEGAP